MAKPGDYVITQAVGQNTFGYFEPKPACPAELHFDFSGPVTVEKRFAKALAQQQGDLNRQVERVNKSRPDVNGDGLPDQFVVEETPDLFIVKLLRGATHQDINESCVDVGDGLYVGFEKEPQVVLQVPKTGDGKRVTVDRIAWVKSSHRGEYGHLVLSGMVFRSADNHADKQLWDLFFTQCPEDVPSTLGPQGHCE